MPAPEAHWWATDAVLYAGLYNPLAKRLCGVSPNAITVASFAMVFPILKTLLNNGGLFTLLALVFVRQSLDCLDGAVARHCNAASKLGAYLDIWSDIGSLVIFFGAVVAQTVAGSRWLLAGTLGGIGVYFGTTMTLMAVKEHTGKRTVSPYANGLDAFVNHNTVLLMLLGATAIHFALASGASGTSGASR